LVDSTESLQAFVSDFARSVNFDYKNSDFNAYPCGKADSVEMMNFYLAEAEMQKAEKNPGNAVYNTVYDGTINLATVLQAPAIGTKGHYYELDSQLSERLPVMVDHKNNTIAASEEVDNTWLGVERYSGVTLQARERIMVSFLMEDKKASPNGLFSHLEQGWIVPLTFVARDAVMTDEQVSQILD